MGQWTSHFFLFPPDRTESSHRSGLSSLQSQVVSWGWTDSTARLRDRGEEQPSAKSFARMTEIRQVP